MLQLCCCAHSLHSELDWKLIALRTDDPLASQVSTLDDVEKHFPGELQKVLEWFRDYKIPDGKPANKFGLDEVRHRQWLHFTISY